MMKKTVLSLFILTWSSFSFAMKAESCSVKYKEVSYRVLDCMHRNHLAKNCDYYMDSVESSVQIKRATNMFFFNKELNELMMGERFTFKKIDTEELYSLRGKDITRFIKKSGDILEDMYVTNDFTFNLPFGASNGYRGNLVKNFYSRVNELYEEYFVRYVKILKREIPWDLIKDMEKGLSFGEISDALVSLDSDCGLVLRRYKNRLTWKDLAKETVAHYFKKKLYRKEISE